MSSACQVDFYVLAGPAQSAHQLACRLAMMAWEQGHRVAVVTADQGEAETLDEIMWDYPAGRFLPHQKGASPANTPICIDVSGKDIATDRDVVINLSDTAVPEPARFRRLLEIVPGAEQKRLASREKFREYRKLGLSPVSHPIGK
jgi:DNA polymerase-3 subunit chi